MNKEYSVNLRKHGMPFYLTGKTAVLAVTNTSTTATLKIQAAGNFY